MLFRIFLSCSIIAYIQCDSLPDGLKEFKTPEEISRELKGNAEQQGENDGKMMEGDMVVTEDGEGGTDRNMINSKRLRWPKDDNGIVKVPYVISKSFNGGASGKANLLSAMKDFRKWTCIDIVPRTDEKHYIEIISSTGCWSSVGNQRRKQQLSLAKACTMDVGTPSHELMHAVGFRHEQNRNDRDDYVTIIFDKIPKEKQNNFIRCPDSECTLPKFPYDPQSVMHYESTAFSIDGRATIVAKNKTAGVMGQRFGLSNLDIKKLDQLYKCRGKTVEPNDGIPPLERPNDINSNCATWITTCADPNDDYRRYRYCQRTCWNMVKGSNYDTYPDCESYMAECNQSYFKKACAKTCGHPRPTNRD